MFKLKSVIIVSFVMFRTENNYEGLEEVKSQSKNWENTTKLKFERYFACDFRLRNNYIIKK